MAISSKFRRAATATALSALVGGGALLTAGAATAAPAEPSRCVPTDLNVSVTEGHAPNDGRLFAITFEAKPGVSCTVEGAPSGLTFFNGETVQGIEVISPEPGSAQPYTIDEQHPGVAYVAAPAESSAPAPVSSITFDLPSRGGISAAWPSAIDGPVRVGNIGPQVS
ncbi:hypothetical protein OOZ19_13775 [Saccharopolyspora sp. NFXS83]|uniref:hypothetical protein n=1 Tax=Saccharopolyspora sp. NFXS83 TaxID=2993560 RepID=UPI00224B0EF7|nr:hypothetical protein [Saccharopolyspora sp. NFXS83]MCX2731310.1 hypothetical protein [Saccharopolyspora sp. NFXS83]